MLLVDQLSNALHEIPKEGYHIGKICKLAGVCRKTLWNAYNKPETVTLNTADRIIHAIKKMRDFPFEFKKNPYGD